MKKLRIVVLFSEGIDSLKYLFENDPNYGVNYEIVAAICNKNNTTGEIFCKKNKIEFISFNTKDFCEKKGYTDIFKKLPTKIKESYFNNLLKIIRSFKADVVLLSDFKLEITSSFLKHCLLLNVHHADLSLKDENGKPKYGGPNAVAMAMEAGEEYTASTVYFVENEVECGRILCVSDHLLIEQGVSAAEQENKMKINCDGQVYQKALEEIFTAYNELFLD